jgi:VanZ family protein
MATVGRSGATWGPPILWAALIFAFSAQPDLRFVPDDALDFAVRKAGHMAVFGILALLLWRALASTTDVRRPAAWALALTVLYAISDELHQGAVDGRHASALDVGFDSVGAVIAIVVTGLVQARKMRRSAE